MEKIIFVLFWTIAIACSWFKRKTLLIVFPVIYIIYRIFAAFQDQIEFRVLEAIMDSLGVAWIGATTYYLTNTLIINYRMNRA